LDNSIETKYYENGNIKSESDRINKTNKTFYENGTQKSYNKTNTSETINYDEKGRKTYHSYSTKENGWCEEYFENGLITSKICDSSDHLQQTNYYKNGKLDYYEVRDHTKHEMRKYDRNNKLLSTDKMTYPNSLPTPKTNN